MSSYSSMFYLAVLKPKDENLGSYIIKTVLLKTLWMNFFLISADSRVLITELRNMTV